MANAAGGDIVFGIAECREDGKPTGIPDSVSGLGSLNLDAESLRLENMIRDGIEPRINGLQLWAVRGFDNGPVLVLWVPKSCLALHMVKTGDSRFYSRNPGDSPVLHSPCPVVYLLGGTQLGVRPEDRTAGPTPGTTSRGSAA